MEDPLTEYLMLLEAISKNELKVQEVIQNLYIRMYSPKKLEVHSLRTTKEAYSLLGVLSKKYHPKERGAVHKTLVEALLSLIALREASSMEEILAIKKALVMDPVKSLIDFLNSNSSIPEKIRRILIELILDISKVSHNNSLYETMPLSLLLKAIGKVAGTDKRTLIHWVQELHKWGFVEYYLQQNPKEVLSFEDTVHTIETIITSVANLKWWLFEDPTEQVEAIKRATLRALGFSLNKHHIQEIMNAIQGNASSPEIENTIQQVLFKNMIKHPYLFRFKLREEIMEGK